MIDSRLFHLNPLPARAVPFGYILLIPGLILFMVSVKQFNKYSGEWPVSAYPPKNIIQKGLFSAVRHPIYLFALIAISGMGLILKSRGFVFIVLPIFSATLIIYILVEEKFLIKRMGKKYLDYRKQVPLLIPRFHNWVRLIAYLIFPFLFNLKIKNKQNIPDSGPFFVISSHRNYLDPFFISYALPFQVKHLCTFEMFRNKRNEIIFNHFGAIPKKRYKKDIKSSMGIIKALSDGYVIGIFPEGGRSWTGELRTLKTESLKLLGHFHLIPILPVRIQGNYHAWPRWSDKMLRARVFIDFGKVLHLKKDMSLKEINKLLEDAIKPIPEYESGFTIRNKITNSKLPTVLYRCPECKTPNALENKLPNSINCRFCSHSLQITPNLLLKSNNSNIKVWDIPSLYKMIKISEHDLPPKKNNFNPASEKPEETILLSSNGRLFIEDQIKFRLILDGEIILTPYQIIFYKNNSKQFQINLQEIDGLTIESNFKLQIYLGLTGILYQVVLW